MKLVRDKITKEVKYSWDTHELGYIGMLAPDVDDTVDEVVDMPEETIRGFQKKCREKSPNGKIGKYRLLDDGTIEVDDPVPTVTGTTVADLEDMRVRGNKSDNAPLTYGDIRTLYERKKKEAYDRL